MISPFEFDYFSAIERSLFEVPAAIFENKFIAVGSCSTFGKLNSPDSLIFYGRDFRNFRRFQCRNLSF